MNFKHLFINWPWITYKYFLCSDSSQLLSVLLTFFFVTKQKKSLISGFFTAAHVTKGKVSRWSCLSLSCYISLAPGVQKGSHAKFHIQSRGCSLILHPSTYTQGFSSHIESSLASAPSGQGSEFILRAWVPAGRGKRGRAWTRGTLAPLWERRGRQSEKAQKRKEGLQLINQLSSAFLLPPHLQ